MCLSLRFYFVAEFFGDIYHRYKQHPLVGIYMLHKPFLIINDLDLTRDVLAKQFTNFHDRGFFCNEKTDPLSGHLFQLPGKKWRNLRVKLTPTFTAGKLKQMFPIMKDIGNTLATYLEEKAQTRSTIDVKDVFSRYVFLAYHISIDGLTTNRLDNRALVFLNINASLEINTCFFRYAVDIIMSAAFGITCDSLENPDNEFRYWGKKIFDPKPLWNALIVWAPQVFDFFSIPYTDKDVTNFFINVFKETVEYRESNNIERKDFLNLLMQLMRNGYVEADDNSEAATLASNYPFV